MISIFFSLSLESGIYIYKLERKDRDRELKLAKVGISTERSWKNSLWVGGWLDRDRVGHVSGNNRRKDTS